VAISDGILMSKSSSMKITGEFNIESMGMTMPVVVIRNDSTVKK